MWGGRAWRLGALVDLMIDYENKCQVLHAPVTPLLALRSCFFSFNEVARHFTLWLAFHHRLHCRRYLLPPAIPILHSFVITCLSRQNGVTCFFFFFFFSFFLSCSRPLLFSSAFQPAYARVEFYSSPDVLRLAFILKLASDRCRTALR